MAYVVGVTGGIGSGKTTVANLFAEKGIEVIDADVIARQVVEPGSEGLKAIAEKFGASMLNDDGTLNLGALRGHVFSHPEDKEWLNGLLHPKIRQEMITQTAQAKSLYCLLVIPLLVENSLQSLCQRVPSLPSVSRRRRTDHQQHSRLSAVSQLSQGSNKICL